MKPTEQEQQIASLTAEVAARRDLLEEIQWAAGICDAPRCPACRAWDYGGHRPNCALAAALKSTIGQDYMSPADVRAKVQPLVLAVAYYRCVLAEDAHDFGRAAKIAEQYALAQGWVEEEKK